MSSISGMHGARQRKIRRYLTNQDKLDQLTPLNWKQAREKSLQKAALVQLTPRSPLAKHLPRPQLEEAKSPLTIKLSSNGKDGALRNRAPTVREWAYF
ncbi:MAG TPA: hypothetical protein VGY56_16155 [Verrucomicrobiae bacterium]|nr:hypothetical protein [Verrucomicrobiae bacterium]